MANQLFHIVITTHSTLCEGYLKATKLILTELGRSRPSSIGG